MEDRAIAKSAKADIPARTSLAIGCGCSPDRDRQGIVARAVAIKKGTRHARPQQYRCEMAWDSKPIPLAKRPDLLIQLRRKAESQNAG